ncbi:MAG: 4Fe-4S binding protein [Candidatus Coatesbacteria bacterium]|nr:4Fe-4S binding protein [Candidatus Coatesbacteria bacterium]
MTDNNFNMHYVCTHEEAQKLIDESNVFLVSNCGCRENKGNCERSRMDVCLSLVENNSGSGSNQHEVDRDFANKLILEAREKLLVTRPFRDPENRNIIAGICFCCDDCCSYFNDENEISDKGRYIEKTDLSRCTNCCLCVDACFFKARTFKQDRLQIDSSRCYGCGNCRIVCSVNCIKMVEREKGK